jgi:4'-phosphopantetheinyl transferase
MERPTDSLHVWLTETESVPRDRLPDFRQLLSPEELARHDRFVFEKDRNLFLIARAHLRNVLSQYADVSPDAWQFRSSPLGRPEIANTSYGPPIHFNLSHTRGLVASVVSGLAEIGIDAEHCDRLLDHQRLARSTFSRQEADAIERASETDRPLLFFQLWTLKEAYSKARGRGMSLAFDRFGFDITASGITAHLDDLSEDAAGWHFEVIRPTREHQVAIAARFPAGHHPSIDTRRLAL